MYEATQVISGLGKFIEKDFIARLEDPLKQVLLGAGAGIWLRKGPAIIEDLKASFPIIKTMGLIDDKGAIDIDLLYTEIKPRVRKTPITVNVPYVGNIVIKETDIEHLYKYIQEQT